MREAVTSIRRVARQKGIELVRPSSDGRAVRVSDENLRRMLLALGENVDCVTSGTDSLCYAPADLVEQPAWGLSLQLYELRSSRNWGVGDFKDLWTICGLAGRLGADFVGLNPLHAGFLSDATRCSPYEPSNRRFLNPLYIAVDEVGGFVNDTAIEAQLSKLRARSLVDYEAVARLKLGVLHSIWEAGRKSPNLAFEEFVREGSENLRLHALFETLSRAQSASGLGAGWGSWPPEYQSPHSEAVDAFEKEHHADIEFHQWLQWLAHVQLCEARECCSKADMRIGLYLDIAVGEALDGSATWSDEPAYVAGAAVGNPPEPFATQGQDWKLAALRPDRITAGEPSPFTRLMTASMRYAGAIRIDHAAAFARLYLVPTNATPADGAYVRYPVDDMLEQLANMSRHYKCLVIGEDLGEIASGLREDLDLAGVLSYRILSYEQTEEGFVLPEHYPQLALACVSTHDHQTFAGWWKGADIALRLEHELVSEETTIQHQDNRIEERKRVLEAFSALGLAGSDASPRTMEPEQLVVAAHEFIAMTPSMLASVRLADLTGEPLPTNIPGTDISYPNWRPKLSVDLEDLEKHPRVRRIAAIMNQYRPHHAKRSEGKPALC